MTPPNKPLKPWKPSTSHMLKGTLGNESHRGEPPKVSANHIKKHYKYDGATGKIYFKRLQPLPEFERVSRTRAARNRRKHIERWNKRYAGQEVKLRYNPRVGALVINMSSTDYHTGTETKCEVLATSVAWYLKMGYWPGSIKFFNTDWSDLRWHNLYIPRRRWNSLLARMKSPMEAVPDMPSHMFNPNNPFGHYYREMEEKVVTGELQELPVGGWQLVSNINYLPKFSVNRASGRNPYDQQSDKLAWTLVRAQRAAGMEHIPFVNDPETENFIPPKRESPIEKLKREHAEKKKRNAPII